MTLLLAFVSQYVQPVHHCCAVCSCPSLLHWQAFAALADNAKHNQTGRVDEHGALRHRLPELCGVGALAMLFFAMFHILDHPLPDFSPDFAAQDCGQYGVRPWYQYHVFWPTRKTP